MVDRAEHDARAEGERHKTKTQDKMNTEETIRNPRHSQHFAVQKKVLEPHTSTYGFAHESA